MSETTVYTDFRLQGRHLAETGERAPAEVAVRRDLAAAYQLCALFGWDDLVYTHISARVPGPDHHFLVNRSYLHSKRLFWLSGGPERSWAAWLPAIVR